VVVALAQALAPAQARAAVPADCWEALYWVRIAQERIAQEPQLGDSAEQNLGLELSGFKKAKTRAGT